MYINKNTIIIGERVLLVPYRREHVAKYHGWMQSEELRTLTASEPLTLEEEYEMQASWHRDVNKLTFIILDKTKYEETNDEIESMIGDTNLFFTNSEDSLCAEAEIMIAEEWARGHRCGWEAMLLMFLYGIDKFSVRQYVVKISCENEISIRMFSDMGFIEMSRSAVFNEVTLCKLVEATWCEWIRLSVGQFEVREGNCLPTSRAEMRNDPERRSDDVDGAEMKGEADVKKAEVMMEVNEAEVVGMNRGEPVVKKSRIEESEVKESSMNPLTVME